MAELCVAILGVIWSFIVLATMLGKRDELRHIMCCEESSAPTGNEQR
jgi:hypothetical protein